MPPSAHGHSPACPPGDDAAPRGPQAASGAVRAAAEPGGGLGAGEADLLGGGRPATPFGGLPCRVGGRRRLLFRARRTRPAHGPFHAPGAQSDGLPFAPVAAQPGPHTVVLTKIPRPCRSVSDR